MNMTHQHWSVENGRMKFFRRCLMTRSFGDNKQQRFSQGEKRFKGVAASGRAFFNFYRIGE